MTKYISLFRIRFIGGLQYRAAALAGLSTQFAWGFMNILAFRAFYASNPGAFPMEFPALVSYVWLNQAFLSLFATWATDRDIMDSITTGQIAYEMTRPMDLYGKWFCESFANRFCRATLRCLPVLGLALMLKPPFRLYLPQTPAVFGLFIISLLLGAMVICAYCMIVYIITFHTLNPSGIMMTFAILADFMSGWIIPLTFFPPGIREIAELSPFGSAQNVPFRIYSGNISGEMAVYRILLQLFWLFALVVLGKILMRNSLKKIIVQGG